MRPGLGARAFVALQYLLPQISLSRLVGALARARAAWIRRPLIGAFVRGFRPELADAVVTDPQAYPSFNAFFTRALQAGARPPPEDANAIACPVDGRISAMGTIDGERIFQAKGHDYSLLALLAGNAALAANYANGLYMTIYLAPFNYHRIHMALDGTLRSACYVPGRLFSVNDVTARLVPGLFARNERVILEFGAGPSPTASSPSIMVMVGALFVGSMGTVWHGDVAPARRGGALPLPLPPTPEQAVLARGAELGRFNMGSTVILLLPPRAGAWNPALQPGATVRVGQPIGALAGHAAP